MVQPPDGVHQVKYAVWVLACKRAGDCVSIWVQVAVAAGGGAVRARTP